jgi:glycosyltransferase involved in cell wall biosynthesis
VLAQLWKLAGPELAGTGAILEIGCGSGFWLRALADGGVAESRLHGIELLEHRANAARERAPRANVRTGDALALPYESDSFELVLLFTVLSSLPSDESARKALAEARRVLVPGGLLVCYEPRIPNPGNRSVRLIRRSVFGPGTNARSVTVLPALARRLGRVAPWAYPALGHLGALRTHRIAWQRSGSAVLVVRNAATHDTRVFRAADTVRRAGLAPSILAARTTTEPRPVSDRDGIPIYRLNPRARGARARSVLKRPSSEAAGRVDPAPPPRPARAKRSRSTGRRANRLITTIAYYRHAIAWLGRRPAPIVHCNDYNTMWIGVAARILFRSRVVYDTHELWPDRNGRSEPRWLLLLNEALFVRVAHRTVAASPGYAHAMARRYGIRPPLVIRNIPAASTTTSRARRGDRPPSAVYVGGLLPGRGLEQSIRLVALVPELELRLIGPTAPGYAARLTALASELGVSSRVSIEGPVPPERVIDVVRDADIALSLIEPICRSYELTLPNKLFEYALAGVPILASDLPGIAPFVHQHDAGELADPRDMASVLEACERLLEPGRNEACRAALAEARASLDSRAEQEQLRALYEELL